MIRVKVRVRVHLSPVVGGEQHHGVGVQATLLDGRQDLSLYHFILFIVIIIKNIPFTHLIKGEY